MTRSSPAILNNADVIGDKKNFKPARILKLIIHHALAQAIPFRLDNRGYSAIQEINFRISEVFEMRQRASGYAAGIDGKSKLKIKTPDVRHRVVNGPAMELVGGSSPLHSTRLSNIVFFKSQLIYNNMEEV
jgi:hypothetical protein